MSTLTILGRQPALGIAELERSFGAENVYKLSSESIEIKKDGFDIRRFGGVPKAGKILFELPGNNWNKNSQKIIEYFENKWANFPGKITLGISTYNFNISPREVQKIGIIIKQRLKKDGVSLRLIPNINNNLSTATSHHNKLGLSDNKIELLILKTSSGKTIIAQSTGSQNITAYANRDQKRPKRDAFVGMLPPKLAQTMINLAASNLDNKKSVILDPFCGTGVILQEAALLGFSVYGSDLSEKMVQYTKENLDWLSTTHHIDFSKKLLVGDATKTSWQQPVNAVVSETYLGQPFSAIPSPAKLHEVKDNCNHIITEFLKNLANQITPGTSLCIAVPAWRNANGSFTHLPLINSVTKLGYKSYEFKNIQKEDLLYYRENQIVARELLVLSKI